MGEGEDPGRGEGVTGALRRLASRLERLGLRSLVLFGSRARGDSLAESDVDVIVVAEAFRGLPFYETEYLVLREWDSPEPLEPWCYTPEEARAGALERPRLDIVDALERGVVVYDDGFWEALRREYLAGGRWERAPGAGGHSFLRLDRRRRGGG